MVLILDDDISRVEEFESRSGLKARHAPNFGIFLGDLDLMIYDLIMLDHDLGLNEPQGIDAAKHLANRENMPLWPADHEQLVIVHSANPIGAANMMAALSRATHIKAYAIPFAWTKVSFSPTKGLTFRI